MIKIRNRVYDTSIEEVLVKLRQELKEKYDKSMLHDIKDIGENIMITCPYHKDGQEHKPSCGISKHEKKRYNKETPMGIVHCFTCKTTKPFEVLISNLLGYEDNGEKGIEWLEKEYKQTFNRDITIDISRGQEKKKEEYVEEELLKHYRYYHGYMYQRGLTDEIIEKYDVGYDKINECITFPVRDINGNCLFVAKRAVYEKKFYLPSTKEKPIYGLFEMDKTKNEVYITESIFNALTLIKWGYNAIALLGLGSETQIQEINKLPYREINIVFDGDKWGRIGARKLSRAIRKDKIVKIYDMYDGKDVNDITHEEFKKLFFYFI